jgi:very-short-patch-repair endonuclease
MHAVITEQLYETRSVWEHLLWYVVNIKALNGELKLSHQRPLAGGVVGVRPVVSLPSAGSGSSR